MRPSPLNLLQVPFHLIFLIFECASCSDNLVWKSFSAESFSPGLRINQHELYVGIVSNYFKISLGDRYNKYIFFDNFDESQDIKDEGLIDDEDDEINVFSKLTKEQKVYAKKLVNTIENVALKWIIKEEEGGEKNSNRS